jgi:hypothetical protein
MACTCSQFPALELSRATITKRIKATKRLLANLHLLAVSPQNALKLLVCPYCGCYWQTGHEWNFENKEYAFQVPAIAVADWQEQPYTQPAAWLIYGAMMADYTAKNTFEVSEKPCRVEGCAQRATKLSGVCKAHHIEQLQRFGILPRRPPGRLFAPYE